jgi:hypothetical protein
VKTVFASPSTSATHQRGQDLQREESDELIVLDIDATVKALGQI